MKRFCGGIRKASIALALVETAAKCRAGAPSPSRSTIHWRASFALVSVSSVVNVFEHTTNSVRAGSAFSSTSPSCTPSMFETQCRRRLRLRILRERLGRHHDAEVRAADADVDDVRERLAGGAVNAPAVHAFDEVAHLRQARAHFRHHVLAVDEDRAVRCGCAARRAGRRDSRWC